MHITLKLTPAVPLPSAPPALPRKAWVAPVALALVIVAGCGGGGGSSSSSSGGGSSGQSGLANTGCAFSYSLTGAAVLTGTDPLLVNQWHLTNTGQSGGTAGEELRVAAAWTTTRGAGTKVAVVDDAIEVLHADLAPNVVAGESYDYRPASLGSVYPLPCTTADDHGTAVAGIITARDGNQIGGSGVAPRASLIGYNALATNFDTDIADALTRRNASVGIFHNSWGSPDDGKLHPAEASFENAINSGITSGRSGRGSIFVFPAGNGLCYATNSSGRCIDDDSNLDGYVNKRGVISVCAVDHQGKQPVYGESGANVLVCGPTSNLSPTRTLLGGITTTGLQSQYRSDFSGTSASAPMVSGVVSLMLSANPNLTWRDVRLILARTARRNDATDPGWNNTSGLWHNAKYGFGVANAQAAVAAATTWTSVGGSSTLQSCGPFSRSPNLAIADAPSSTVAGPVVQDTLNISGGTCPITRIEFVEVTFSATHAYSGDLRVSLTSPTNTVSQLVNNRICDGTGNACGDYTNWPFGSVRHLDEPAAGNWTLRVNDAEPRDIGTWTNWSIRIFGR
jgi:proprotein convertase subtilisin/kexin type 2